MTRLHLVISRVKSDNVWTMHRLIPSLTLIQRKHVEKANYINHADHTSLYKTNLNAHKLHFPRVCRLDYTSTLKSVTNAFTYKKTMLVISNVISGKYSNYHASRNTFLYEYPISIRNGISNSILN